VSASMEIPFAIGEQLWSTGYGVREELIVCRECAGTRVIEMIKGNGERVSLDCGVCMHCYDPPHPGYEKIMNYEFKPARFVPKRIGMSGEEFIYSESPPSANCYSSAYAKDLFRSFDDCERRCNELNEERARDDEQRRIANLSSKRKSLAFSASYWSQKAKTLREELAVAEARLSRCKRTEAA
jgi:hypothetical protein